MKRPEDSMTCIILAGGIATRMRPITEKIPKALIPVFDKPFCHYQLTWLAKNGIKTVIFSIGYLGHQIRDYVGDGKKWNLRVEYVDEGDHLRGTGGAVRLAVDQLKLSDAFFVIYGDSFLPINFNEVKKAFNGNPDSSLMVIYENHSQWDQSNVVFENNELILYDKTKMGADAQTRNFKYIDYGLSILTPQSIETLIPPGHKYDLADFFHKLSLTHKLQGYLVHDRFYEVGSKSGLADFSDWIKKHWMET